LGEISVANEKVNTGAGLRGKRVKAKAPIRGRLGTLKFEEHRKGQSK